MAQVYNVFQFPYFLEAYNLGLHITNTETILFDHIPSAGAASCALFLNNFTDSNNVVNVNVYGSGDGVNYASISTNVFAGAVNITTFKSATFTALAKFLRITASSSGGTAHLDVFLNGVPL